MAELQHDFEKNDTVEEIMSTHVISCSYDQTVQHAAQLMRDKLISCLIVLKDKAPMGIITERDIVYRLVARNLDASHVLVKELMSAPLKTVSPEENVYYASRVMITNHIKKLPVVKNKRLVGIITQTDLTNYFANQRKEFILDNLRKSIKAAYPV